MILIPVKNLSAAKQRLAALLDQPARTELAQAMLHDVVSAIAAWPGRPACALVTSDPFAVELAEQHDFRPAGGWHRQLHSGLVSSYW